MLSKNLKYYRLKKNYSKKKLASLCNLTPMAITNYEKGDRTPSIDHLKLLADALEVRVIDFLGPRNDHLVFQHGEFRKTRSFPIAKQNYVKEAVEEYFNRFFTIVDILGGEVLPKHPPCHVLELLDNDEENALNLRKHLGFSLTGPVSNLIEALENIGILVFSFDLDLDQFSGMNGFINDRPYIVINQDMSGERIRSTIAHELAHLIFNWQNYSASDELKDEETRATSIAGAFLFPAEDARRELGVHRNSITKDMFLVCKEYGISSFLLTKRAETIGIISHAAAKKYYIEASGKGWRKNEPSRIYSPEVPALFEQLVYRAVSEGEISIQRGAELLKVSYQSVKDNCVFSDI